MPEYRPVAPWLQELAEDGKPVTPKVEEAVAPAKTEEPAPLGTPVADTTLPVTPEVLPPAPEVVDPSLDVKAPVDPLLTPEVVAPVVPEVKNDAPAAPAPVATPDLNTQK